jgi:hypothetical protein
VLADRDCRNVDCPVNVRHVVIGELTKLELLTTLRSHSISINTQAETLFTALPESVRKTVRLLTVILSVRQLGFSDGTTSKDLYARGCELGFSLCPLELAPYLRLQYLDQPEGHWLIVASTPPSGRNDLPTGFYLRRLEDGLWLRGYTADPEHVWDPEDHFVFCRE